MAKVLIAVLDANLGYVLGRELEDEGHIVSRMSRDRGLTAFIAENPAYDAVLIDFLISSLSELRSLRAIKKTFPHIHIIVFADSVAPQERAALLNHGADKSFTKHELNDLKEHLRSNFCMQSS